MNSEGSEAEDNQAVASGFEGHENELDSSPTMTDDVKDNGVKEEGDSEKNIEKDNQSYDKKPSASNSFESEEEAPETVRGKEVPPSEIPVPPVHEQKPKKKKVKRAMKYCKAPQAPKRFKSAFIFFTMARHGEIRKKLEAKGAADKTPDVAKIISEEWRNMPPKERAVWDEKAKIDKERYEIEKSMYTGPWKIPSRKRSQKDPEAPKRPMSSFLAFSNGKRSDLKKKNPSMTNTDISKLLAKMWKGAPDEEKKEYIEKESKLREIYKKDMAAWKQKIKDEEVEKTHQKEKLAKELMSTTSMSAGAAAAAAEQSARGGSFFPHSVFEARMHQAMQGNHQLFSEAGSGVGFGMDDSSGRYYHSSLVDNSGIMDSSNAHYGGDGYDLRMQALNNYRLMQMQQQQQQQKQQAQKLNDVVIPNRLNELDQRYNPIEFPTRGNPDSHWNSMRQYPSHPTSFVQQRMNYVDNNHDSSYASAGGNPTENQLTHLLRRRQEQYRVASQAQGGIDHMVASRGLEPHGSLGHDYQSSNLTNQLFGERERAPSRSHREQAGYSQQMRGDTGDPPPSSPSPYSDADRRNF